MRPYETRRRSGKSTILALEAISSAIDRAGKWIDVVDHHKKEGFQDDPKANRMLFDMIFEMTQHLGLVDFEFNYKTLQIKSNFYGLIVNNKTGEVREATEKD